MTRKTLFILIGGLTSILLLSYFLVPVLVRYFKTRDIHTGKRSNIRVPEGLGIEQVAGYPDVEFPMFATFDECGRLFVVESSGTDQDEKMAKARDCRIKIFEDRDQSGRYLLTSVFADNLIFPMGLAWRAGKLYVADAPDLLVFEDTNGDGKADKRSVLLTGFARYDDSTLHGLQFGPDGMLYMTLGEKNEFTLQGKDGAYLVMKSGGLLRCRPDGSNLEVLCRGFGNLIEIMFDRRGNIIGGANWWQQPKEDGIRDALAHLIDGGVYHEQMFDEGKPEPYASEQLTGISMFPIVAFSGMLRYRGQAFPPEMHGNLIATQYNPRKVTRHVFTPQGSTFRSENIDFITSDDPDFRPSDVMEAADGSLFLLDTGNWYRHHCPTGNLTGRRSYGGIYHIRAVGAKPPADPWGLKIDWGQAKTDQLVAFLEDPRFVVRDRAQDALAARGRESVAALAAVINGNSAHAVKQRALWTLSRIAGASALEPLRQALLDPNPDISIPAMRIIALREDRKSAPQLCKLLQTEDPAVQLNAAEALRRCGDVQCLPFLWQALTKQPDRFLEHALTYTLYHLADGPALKAALLDPHPRVQKAALLLLDQPSRPRGQLQRETVIQRIKSADAELRQAALRILKRHPEWAEGTASLMRAWLEQSKITQEEQSGLRDLLLAYQAQPATQELIGAALTRDRAKISLDRQVFLLETLSQGSLPELPQSWLDGISQALRQANPELRLQAVKTAAVLQAAQLDEQLSSLAEDKKEPTELRVEAVRALVRHKPQLSAGVFDLLLNQVHEEKPSLDRLTAAGILGQSRLTDPQKLQLLKAVRDDVLISPATLLPALKNLESVAAGAAVIDYFLESSKNGWKPDEKELRKVIDGYPEKSRARSSALFEQLRQNAALQLARLKEYEPLLEGGDAERGRAVFYSQKGACATCHRIDDKGGQVGPNLSKIGTIRAGRDLLESILVPSSTIAQGYENYFVTTADGRSLTGVIARQSADTLVLRDASGAELQFQRKQLDEIKRLPTSLMPEGLERPLSKEEFRDLLAFLKGRK